MIGTDSEEPVIKIQHIQTELQQADIMTKPIPRQQFQFLQQLICGW